MRVLFLTHRLPYAPNRGDRIRAYYLMQEMARFADVSLFSLLHDEDEVAQAGNVPFATHVATAFAPRLRNLTRGALGLPTSRPLTHALLDAPDARSVLSTFVAQHPPDVVVAYCSGMARFAMEPPLAGLPFVLDMVDVDSKKWDDLSHQGSHARRWVYRREARTLKAFEVRAAERAEAVTVVTERERDELLALTTRANVYVMGNGVDVEVFAPQGPPATEPVVIFSGVMDYAPNVEAATWFATEVWPIVRSARPDARFVILGARPSKAVLALAAKDASITVTGRVDAVQPYLWNAAVSVAPIAVARGIQNKVLEALAAGLPTVVSEAVAAGLPHAVSPGVAVAADPEGFARQVLALLSLTADERRHKATAADVASLSWASRLAALEGMLGAAVSRGHERMAGSR
jgi:sugar transferase (PEP-CTERM/EpsH1 system associated)